MSFKCRIILFACLISLTNVFAQQIISDNTLVDEAFKLAVRTVDINTRRGILAAGGDYGGEWTRDISINSWNGASLLRPEVAEKSLWSVTVNKDSIGHQYWDKIIWVIAAYNHFLVTGDEEFLKQAYKCSATTMQSLEHQVFDEKYGLFKGPSVFNDGIAAYPEPVYEPSNNSSSVLDHKNAFYIKCLSTNCVYYGAYVALGKMSMLLKQKVDITRGYFQKSEILKQNILKYFYNNDSDSFNYLIDQNGKAFKSQEGLGISFAVIFGIINGDEAHKLIANARVSKFGITSIYPDFLRYSNEKPGRHNNIVWPMVNGFFAKAAIASKNYAVFSNELYTLSHLAIDEDKGDYNFREIYNPYSGKPDGGWQANGELHPDFHWESCKLQTWSATAYISMVINGIMGLRLNEQSLSFSPFLPEELHSIKLKGLVYRNSVLNISIIGRGKMIKTFMLDGKPNTQYLIRSTLKGKHTIFIALK